MKTHLTLYGLFLFLAFALPLRAQPCATNAFCYSEGGVRIFSIDWVGLSAGHTYEAQSSGDGKSWRRRARLTWTSTNPTAYWRSQFPMPPPSPAGLNIQEQFRLADITANSAPLLPSVRSIPSVLSVPSTTISQR